MATLFCPFVNQTSHANDLPLWAMFVDDDEELRPHRPCSASARRPPTFCQRKPSSANGQPRGNGRGQSANPQEFITSIASVFLPGLLEAVAAAAQSTENPQTAKAEPSASTSTQGAPKNCDEFLSTAAAFASTYFPELFEAVTEAIKKDEAKPAAPSDKAFEVKLNVSEYRPQELNVKTVENTVVIEGKQEEKEDGQGFVSRSFTRRFVIPEGVKPETVDCKLTSDGFLILSAPLIVEAPVANERAIPITLSSRPAEALVSTPVVEIPKETLENEDDAASEQAEAADASATEAAKSVGEDSDEDLVIVPKNSVE